MNGGMDDLELAEELLLDNHLFNILWQKFKKIQSQPNHLYPQISGSNLRSETRYTHETFKNLHCTNYTPLSASTSSLALTPKRFPSAKRQHDYGTPKDLQGCTTVQIWIYFSILNSIYMYIYIYINVKVKKKGIFKAFINLKTNEKPMVNN